MPQPERDVLIRQCKTLYREVFGRNLSKKMAIEKWPNEQLHEMINRLELRIQQNNQVNNHTKQETEADEKEIVNSSEVGNPISIGHNTGGGKRIIKSTKRFS